MKYQFLQNQPSSFYYQPSFPPTTLENFLKLRTPEFITNPILLLGVTNTFERQNSTSIPIPTEKLLHDKTGFLCA